MEDGMGKFNLCMGDSTSPDLCSRVNGSRFDGRATPILHERKRCVPPRENHLRRIGIRVFFVAAAGANKARLALATSLVGVAARGACAGGVSGRDFDEFSAPFFKFVGQ